ncbi:MAG: XRE family transcriptional regulator [Bacteriovoracaceae bacterium]|nr:XRE family transcriptional regulator [Bacteriovoracaceae bacterium]
MKKKLSANIIDERELDKSIENGDISPVYIPRFATLSDIIKYHFCNEIIRYKKTNELKQKDIAKMIDVNKSEVSKLFSYNLKEFSQERLLGFIEVLIGRGADIDLEKTWNQIKKQSKKLTKKIRAQRNNSAVA